MSTWLTGGRTHVECRPPGPGQSHLRLNLKEWRYPRLLFERKPGQIVTVTPDDTGRDSVVSELVASDAHEVVIRRSDHEIGEVCVHFPRTGFVVGVA